jgi:hypothetical protein
MSPVVEAGRSLLLHDSAIRNRFFASGDYSRASAQCQASQQDE